VTHIKKLRQSIDASLDRWEASAQSFEDGINASLEAMVERFDDHKATAQSAVEDLKQSVARAQEVPAEAKKKIIAELDHLKLQLALGKAEAQDALAVQKSKVESAFQAVELRFDSIGRQINDDVDKALENWIRAEIALKQDFDLLAVHIAAKQAAVHAQFEARRQSFKDQIEKFKAELENKKDTAEERGEAFSAEMNSAFDHLNKAFRNLVT
jgi:archaellum component FlaC